LIYFTSMVKTLFNYLMESEMLIPKLTLLVLLITAWFIYKSAKATEHATQAQLYVRLWEYYSSKEMLEGLRLLRVIENNKYFKRWKKEEPNTEEEIWQGLLLVEDIQKEIAKKVKDYRHYQRFVKYYFLRIYHLDEQGFLPRHLVKDLLSVDGIELFFEVVKPLEYLEKPDFDSSDFDALYARAKELDIKELPTTLWEFKK